MAKAARTNKHTIFISHINEEKEIANALKEFLEDKFLGIANVFASSHEDSLQLGDKWLDRILESMKDCSLLIVLCSPISVTRQWINFEAGAGWIQGIPVIPLCHSGMELSELPVPINTFQGGLLNSIDDARKLFRRISKALGSREPKIEERDFFENIKTYEAKIENSKLQKDMVFVSSYLQNSIIALKALIIRSTVPLDGGETNIDRMQDYEFSFNDVRYCFNASIYFDDLDDTRTYQDFHHHIGVFKKEIEFLLTYRNIEIPDQVRDLFHLYLSAEYRANVWFHYFKGFEKLEAHVFRPLLDQVKSYDKKLSEIDLADDIIAFLFYYRDLVEVYNWILEFEDIGKKILGSEYEKAFLDSIERKPD